MTVVGLEPGWTSRSLKLFSQVCCFPISAPFQDPVQDSISLSIKQMNILISIPEALIP